MFRIKIHTDTAHTTCIFNICFSYRWLAECVGWAGESRSGRCGVTGQQNAWNNDTTVGQISYVSLWTNSRRKHTTSMGFRCASVGGWRERPMLQRSDDPPNPPQPPAPVEREQGRSSTAMKWWNRTMYCIICLSRAALYVSTTYEWCMYARRAALGLGIV